MVFPILPLVPNQDKHKITLLLFLINSNQNQKLNILKGKIIK